MNEGTGTFVVTAVGVNSSYGRGDTLLQKKLNKLADSIAWLGAGAALLLLIILTIKFCVGLKDDGGKAPAQRGQEYLTHFITAVAVVVVAVPEGLPSRSPQLA